MDSTKGKINYKVGYLAYVAYNKEGLNHVHACMCQYDLEEIKASSRKTNPWKNISHKRIMRLIWMCRFKGSKSHQFLSTKFNHYHSQGK